MVELKVYRVIDNITGKGLSVGGYPTDRIGKIGFRLDGMRGWIKSQITYKNKKKVLGNCYIQEYILTPKDKYPINKFGEIPKTNNSNVSGYEYIEVDLKDL